MANTDKRTYIGARYVPRFMGRYAASQAYEGLDVVDDGVGNAYIAKKPVPANTPLSTTEYWMVYFTYGGIADLQRQIDTINGDIADMKDGTVEGSLQNQIDGLDNAIDTITTSLSGNYIVQSQYEEVSIISDGVKTLSQLLDDLLTTLNTKITNGKAVEVISINIPNYGQGVPDENGITTSAFSRVRLVGVRVNTPYMQITEFEVKTSGSYLHRATITVTNSSIAYEDVGSTVPTSGLTHKISYRLYKEV